MIGNLDFYDQMDYLIPQIKKLAIEYYEITGKPLGVTGEIGEFEAAQKLDLLLVEARTAGYDAIRKTNGIEEKIQIKSRRILPNSKPGQRIGSIKFNYDWDIVMLVLLDEFFDPVEIHEATRDAVMVELNKPGSKARNERGALGVWKFKHIAELVWSRKDVLEIPIMEGEIMIEKAKDLVQFGEKAVVLFTRGPHFLLDRDGNGSTGNWVINEDSLNGTDKVIIYKRDETNGKNIVFLGDYQDCRPSNEARRLILSFNNMKEVGLTQSNWIQFGGVGGQPVFFL